MFTFPILILLFKAVILDLRSLIVFSLLIRFSSMYWLQFSTLSISNILSFSDLTFSKSLILFFSSKIACRFLLSLLPKNIAVIPSFINFKAATGTFTPRAIINK